LVRRPETLNLSLLRTVDLDRGINNCDRDRVRRPRK
jgi:hypothetical protein